MRSYLLVRQDPDMAIADGPELVPGGRGGFCRVEVLKLMGDGTVVGGHRLVQLGQDLWGCRLLGRPGWRAFGHFLSPLSSSLGKTG